MNTVYFAGPDVFKPDYKNHSQQVRDICAAYGVTPLLPGDGDFNDSRSIFKANLRLIEKADGIIANLNPFRSLIEPDSGTVFECAYAYGLKKFVIGVLTDRRDMLTKLKAAGAGPVSGRDEDPDPHGWLIENFGQPLNLMLSESLNAITAELEEAVKLASGMRL